MALMLLGVSVSPAQEPAVGSALTNQAISTADDHLTMSLPKAGVDLDAPRTSMVRLAGGIENGSVGELFQGPATIAEESSPGEADDPVVTSSFGSLEFTHETKAVRGRGMSVSGPLVQLFDAAKPAAVPKQFLQLINPLAPMEPSPVNQKVTGEHRKAWATLIGWNPGGSAFPDPRTHVPTLDLFSMFTSP